MKNYDNETVEQLEFELEKLRKTFHNLMKNGLSVQALPKLKQIQTIETVLEERKLK